LILTKPRRASQPLPVPPNRQHEKTAVDPDLGFGRPGVQASSDHVADACSHAFDVLCQVHLHALYLHGCVAVILFLKPVEFDGIETEVAKLPSHMPRSSNVLRLRSQSRKIKKS
jgi:hypothetical protein